MRNKFRLRRPSPAVVIAMVALFVALGGTAVGASALNKKSVKKIAKSEANKVFNQRSGSLAYVTNSETIGPTGSGGATVSANCPSGLRPIGGGIRVFNDATGIVNDSHPISQGWAGTVFNVGSSSFQVQTTVVCASYEKVSGVPPSTTS